MRGLPSVPKQDTPRSIFPKLGAGEPFIQAYVKKRNKVPASDCQFVSWDLRIIPGRGALAFLTLEQES
jgi:hypothetical protein